MNATALPIHVPNCTLTRVGLSLRDGLDVSEWADIGDFLMRIREGILWCLGDYINFGNHEFGEKYGERLKQFGKNVEARGYSKKTLYQAAWVAKKIDISRRLETLSWNHHLAVAGQGPEDQTKFLQWADEKKATVEQLREKIREDGKDEVATEENLDIPEFSPYAWINDGVRDFKNACLEKPLSKWDDERIVIVWNGLIEVATEIGGPIKAEIQRRKLEVGA